MIAFRVRDPTQKTSRPKMVGVFALGASPYMPYNGLRTAGARYVWAIAQVRYNGLIYCAVPR